MDANPNNPGDTDSRKAICSLLVLEIADYEAKPVFDQIRLTQHLRQVLSDTTAHVRSDDVVSIVQEQGAVLSFLADPEECFATALAIREVMLNQPSYRDLPLRMGINFGKVEITRDEFGHPYVSGAGRRDAERVMNQGPPRQVSVTRAFFEVLSRVAPELAGALEYRGVFSDTVGPPQGLYRLAAPHGGDAPSPATAPGTIPDSPSNAKPSMRPAQPAPNESRRLRQWRLRYALVPLLLVVAALTLSSRFRVEVAGSMPAPQVPAAVSESPTPREAVQDLGVFVTAPAAAANMEQRLGAGSESTAEKPARPVLPSARRGRDAAPAFDRTARLEAGSEQEKRVNRTEGEQPATGPGSDGTARLEPSDQQEESVGRGAEAQPAPAPGSDRTARLEPSDRQEESVDRSAEAQPAPAPGSDRTARLEPSDQQEESIDRGAEAQAAPAASDSATLLLAIRPGGEVYVDGTKVGVTPPLERFQVAPGQRLITIKNGSLPEYRVQLSVAPEAQVTIAHDFSCTRNRELRCWEEIGKGLAPAR